MYIAIVFWNFFVIFMFALIRPIRLSQSFLTELFGFGLNEKYISIRPLIALTYKYVCHCYVQCALQYCVCV